MRLLFELSGEHPTLPAAEAQAALAMQGPVREVARDGALLVLEVPKPDAARLGTQLALTHVVSEALADVPAEPRAILDAVRELAPRVGPRFRVRAHRVGEHGRALVPSALERDAGALLYPGRQVAMGEGADEVRIVLGARAHIGRKLAAVDRTQYDARAVRFRPFFSPVSLHPRFARALCILGGVEKGARVADPFCGTGGLLLEAVLLGAEVHGGDLDPEKAEGSAATLAHFGLRGSFRTGDVAETLPSLGPLDAVVMDPPYGRASTTAREDRLALYQRAMRAAADALRRGGRLAAVFPDAQAPDLAPPELALVERHVQRVHRSLDRHYCVWRKE